MISYVFIYNLFADSGRRLLCIWPLCRAGIRAGGEKADSSIDKGRRSGLYPLADLEDLYDSVLNIAGLGPIFGAIMGAKFRTASYLWIVLGSVLAGATHDYFSGMLSIRHGGESLPEIIGRYLGMTTKQVMRGFTVILMVLVGAVFVAGPAGLLAKLTPDALDTSFWIVVVFLYYILATLLPVDKIIGKIYPILLLLCCLWLSGF